MTGPQQTEPNGNDGTAKPQQSGRATPEGGCEGVEADIISDEAADEAKNSPDKPKSGTQVGKTDPALTPDGMQLELQKNVGANRTKRWAAFFFVGVILLAFFGMLAAAFWKIFFSTYLLEAIKAANEQWQWHVLVFLGVVLVIFAAIPLSLSLAMVKMIGESGKDDSGAAVKTPSVELVRALADIFKAVAASVSR